eukprot:1993526-Pleurochrysis_carterae.AAC.3
MYWAWAFELNRPVAVEYSKGSSISNSVSTTPDDATILATGAISRGFGGVSHPLKSLVPANQARQSPTHARHPARLQCELGLLQQHL